MKNRLSFEKLTKENFSKMLYVKHLLFPESNSDVDYDEYFENKKLSDYFVVYTDNKLCGITGWYAFDESLDNAFMGWFGVLPEYRRRGIGKEILNFTINEVKNKGFSHFRVYTDEIANKESCFLYDKIMDVKERYSYPDKLGETNNFVVFSKCLNGKFEYWHNRPLNEDDNYI